MSWIAVHRASALTPAKPKAVTINNRQYVLYKDTTQSVRFFHDACAHRGAALSKGKVLPDGCLECPYHGWVYDEQGRYRKPRETVFRDRPRDMLVTEQDDLVWVSSNVQEAQPPPAVPFWADDNFSKVCVEITIRQDAQLIIENGIDPTHASWVHANPLGFGKPMEVPRNIVPHGEHGFAFDYHPNPNLPLSRLLGYRDTHNVHAFVVPYTTWSTVHIGKHVLMTYVTILPETEKRSLVRVVVARNFLKSKVFDECFRIMARVILDQDRRILENLDASFKNKGNLDDTDDFLVRRYRECLTKFPE